MNEYFENIIDHYKTPRYNFKPSSYQLSFTKQNLSCGDSITCYLNTDEVSGTYSFVGEGCSLTIAAASIIAEMLNEGKIKEFSKFDLDKFIEFLGIKLTISRKKCVQVSFEAFKDLLNN
jgi:nitrogen fixation NifU-like protein